MDLCLTEPIARFIDHCRIAKRLSPNTLRAYATDLADFAAHGATGRCARRPPSCWDTRETWNQQSAGYAVFTVWIPLVSAMMRRDMRKAERMLATLSAPLDDSMIFVSDSRAQAMERRKWDTPTPLVFYLMWDIMSDIAEGQEVLSDVG